MKHSDTIEDRAQNPGTKKNIFSVQYSKNDIIPSLKLIADEPEYYSDLFGYAEYSDRLFDLLSHSLPDKPFAVCLDGKWGEGKTSLLRRIYSKIEKDSSITNNLPIWFDIWKYERIEPGFMLLAKIINKCSSKNMDTNGLLKLLKSLSVIYYGSNFSREAGTKTNLPLKQVIDDIDEISSLLADAIGDKKIFVFIDHLDRCNVQTINEMLRNIAVLFSSSKLRFVVGVDLGKLENVLRSSYGSTRGDGLDADQSRHLDKIFQLKFVLPTKDETMMKEYVEAIAGRFPKEIQEFLAIALPRNPRKAKEALNLAFYVSSVVGDEEFETVFPFILVWSILASSFHNLSKVIHDLPETLFDLALIVSQTNDFSAFVNKLTVSKGDDSLFNINMKLPRESVSPLSMELSYSYVMHDKALYDYLKALAFALEIDLNTESRKVEAVKKAIRYVSFLS